MFETGVIIIGGALETRERRECSIQVRIFQFYTLSIFLNYYVILEIQM
jgi:hypothetical protein